MKSYDEPIPNNKNRKRQNKKSNSDLANADLSEDGRNYVLYRLNLVETAQDSEIECKRNPRAR